MALRLGRLDGENGFRIVGIDPGDQSGTSVTGAGDVNGDGIDDLIIGATGADRGRRDAGESYVVFGSAAGFPASFDLSTLDGANGFRLEGIDPRDYSGWSVAGAGDVNGDGLDDLMVGARNANPGGTNNAGESYVVFGSSAGFPASLDLSALDGSDGFRLRGSEEYDYSGTSVAGAGDVNGDGLDDLIVAALNAHASYVVFGSTAGFAASHDLSMLDGANGFRLQGSDEAYPESVAGAGDVNGDGIDDLIIGVPFGPDSFFYPAGESYVVFGSDAGFPASLDLSALDGADGFRIDGVEDSDYSGVSVAGAGDVNGDGIDDLIIGARNQDYSLGEGYSFVGESYVVFGSAAGFAPRFDLAALDGTNGFRIEGVGRYDQSGRSVAGAGDFNGDGLDDVIIGAPGASPNGRSSGETYVVFGSVAGFSASLDLSSLNGVDGFRIEGIDEDDYSGESVAGAGDVNGDGFDDLIVGASDADPGGKEDAGETYVVFGFRPAIQGGPYADELAGTEFADRMFGRASDDELYGREGRDRLKGGWGDDRINGGMGRDRVNGGRDDDRLIGGTGSDVFVFRSAFGSDRLRDFDADPDGGQDRLDLRRLGITEAGFAEAVTIADLGEDVEVAVEGQGTILCEDVSGDGGEVIDASDFLLLA